MAVFGDPSAPPPIAKSVWRNAEVLGGFLDSEIIIELFHFWGLQEQECRRIAQNKPSLTLPILAWSYKHRDMGHLVNKRIEP